MLKKLGAIFSAPDSIISPPKRTEKKKPSFGRKNASSGGHLFWLPPVRADFYSIQKLNKIY